MYIIGNHGLLSDWSILLFSLGQVLHSLYLNFVDDVRHLSYSETHFLPLFYSLVFSIFLCVFLCLTQPFISSSSIFLPFFITPLPACVYVVAHVPGNKLTQKDNADSGVQFITPVGPRQSLLLAKDPNQHLWESFIPHVYVSEPTTPNSLRLT